MANPFDAFDEQNAFNRFDNVSPIENAPSHLRGGSMPSHEGAQKTPEQIVADIGLPGLLNVKRAVENTPGSAKKFGMDIYNLFAEFPSVVKGVGDIAKGVYNTAASGEVDPLISQIGDAISQRYGSFDKFKETFETDPVATTFDVAGAIGLAGGAVKSLGKVSKLGSLSNAGEKMVEAANAIDLPGSVVKNGVESAMDAVSKSAMNSATKFSTVQGRVQRNALIDTMRKYNILPNEAGLDKVWSGIETYGKEVDDMIGAAEQGGQRINKNTVFKYANDLIADAKTSGAPIENVRRVEKVYREWEKALAGHTEISPSQAQKFKQGIYREVNYDRKAGNAKPMYNELARKDIARALKEELESINPELKRANLKEGEFLALVEPLTKTVNRLSNRDAFGMGHFLKGSTGAAVAGMATGDAMAGGAGFIAGVIAADPVLQARFSNILYKAKIASEKVRASGQAGSAILQGSRTGETYKKNNNPVNGEIQYSR